MFLLEIEWLRCAFWKSPSCGDRSRRGGCTTLHLAVILASIIFGVWSGLAAEIYFLFISSVTSGQFSELCDELSFGIGSEAGRHPTFPTCLQVVFSDGRSPPRKPLDLSVALVAPCRLPRAGISICSGLCNHLLILPEYCGHLLIEEGAGDRGPISGIAMIGRLA